VAQSSKAHRDLERLAAATAALAVWWLAAAAERPPFCPGTNWAYANTGYAMLGMIIGQLEGRALEAWTTLLIAQPVQRTVRADEDRAIRDGQ
jgi:CubicO group peptidase (beta-lactamase class C family)